MPIQEAAQVRQSPQTGQPYVTTRYRGEVLRIPLDAPRFGWASLEREEAS